MGFRVYRVGGLDSDLGESLLLHANLGTYTTSIDLGWKVCLGLKGQGDLGSGLTV